jgi:hypothetical protein
MASASRAGATGVSTFTSFTVPVFSTTKLTFTVPWMPCCMAAAGYCWCSAKNWAYFSVPPSGTAGWATESYT